MKVTITIIAPDTGGQTYKWLIGSFGSIKFGENMPGTKIYELQSLSRVGSTCKLASDWLHKSE